ncbi:MAG: hypothetical protein IPP07_06660 [Holophagales bacterium]|nr:hypothetical protein [Holophagales bacterium]
MSPDLLMMGGFVVVWILLQYVILPKARRPHVSGAHSGRRPELRDETREA